MEVYVQENAVVKVVTDRDKIQRGIDARNLLEEPLITEAFGRLERDTVDALVAADRVEAMKMAALAERLRVIRDLQQHLITVSLTGQEVEQRIKLAEDE